MIEGQYVILREFKESDIKIISESCNNYTVRNNLTDLAPYPITDHEIKLKYNKNSSECSNKYMFIIELKFNKKIIGECRIIEINWVTRVCQIGISIYESSNRNKGYGADALSLLINFIFYNLNINKIRLAVFSYNKNAIKLYEKFNFKKEAVFIHEVFYHGELHDVFFYTLFLNDWDLPTAE